MEIFDSWDSAKLPSLRPYSKTELFAIQRRMADHLGYNQMNPHYWNTRPVLEKWIKDHWKEWHESRKPQKQLELFELEDYELSPLEQRLNKLRERGLLQREATLIQIQRLDGTMLRRVLPAIANSPFQPGDRIICRYGPGTYVRIKENQALIQLDSGYHVRVDPLTLSKAGNSEEDQLDLEL